MHNNNDFEIEYRSIAYREGQSLAFRGLSFEDFYTLFITHGARVDELKALLPTGGEQIVEDQIDPMALLAQFPEVIAHGLALAADIPEKKDMLRKLPAAVQVQAAMAVWELTMAGNELDVLLGEVIAAFQAATKTIGAASKTLGQTSTG